MADFVRSVIDILNNFTVDTNTSCWLYQGGVDPSVGYGRIMIDGRRYHTHRLAAFISLGLDLDNPKQFACHIRECPNRLCINPRHLYVGDNQSNQLDVVQDKCKRGHDLIGDNIIIKHRTNGKIYRNCRICLSESRKRNREVKATELVNWLNSVGRRTDEKKVG